MNKSRDLITSFSEHIDPRLICETHNVSSIMPNPVMKNQLNQSGIGWRETNKFTPYKSKNPRDCSFCKAILLWVKQIQFVVMVEKSVCLCLPLQMKY